MSEAPTLQDLASAVEALQRGNARPLTMPAPGEQLRVDAIHKHHAWLVRRERARIAGEARTAAHARTRKQRDRLAAKLSRAAEGRRVQLDRHDRERVKILEPSAAELEAQAELARLDAEAEAEAKRAGEAPVNVADVGSITAASGLDRSELGRERKPTRRPRR
jgi:hypothetical protein